MPVTSFSKEKWASIIWPALQATLAKARIAERFPRQVLYGTQLYGGYIIEDPFCKQGIVKLSTFFQECVNNTHTGSLINATVEGFKLELGFDSSAALLPWRQVKTYTTNSWYKHLLLWVQECNREEDVLEVIDSTPMLTKLRINYSFLMLQFIQANVPICDLQIINLIRIHLQAITLTDIATANGTHFSYNAWHGLWGNNLQSELDWPREPLLFSDAQIKIWQDALYSTFCSPHTNANMRVIDNRNKLGKWVSSTSHRKWITFYSPTERQVYGTTSNGFWVYRSIGGGNLHGQRFWLA